MPVLFTSDQKSALDMLVDPELRGHADISIVFVALYIFFSLVCDAGMVKMLFPE